MDDKLDDWMIVVFVLLFILTCITCACDIYYRENKSEDDDNNILEI